MAVMHKVLAGPFLFASQLRLRENGTTGFERGSVIFSPWEGNRGADDLVASLRASAKPPL